MFRLATTVSYFYYLLRLISSAVVIGVPVSRPVGEFFCFGGQTKTVASSDINPIKMSNFTELPLLAPVPKVVTGAFLARLLGF